MSRLKCCAGQEQKAVAIAASALWRLQTGRLFPDHGWIWTDESDDGTVQPRHFAYKSKCKSSVVGGLLLGRLGYFDSGWLVAHEGDLYAPQGRTDTYRKLEDVFPQSFLSGVEDLYEQRWSEQRQVHGQFEYQATCVDDLARTHSRDFVVMAAIFRNIVANNGDFDPTTGLHREIVVENRKGRVTVIYEAEVLSDAN